MNSIRIQRANESLKSAILELQEAVPSKISNALLKIQFPTYDASKSANEQAKALETTLEEFAQVRAALAQTKRKKQLKETMIGWLRASYPFAQLFLIVAKEGAAIPVLNPYGLVCSGLLALLEIAYKESTKGREIYETVETLSATIHRVRLTDKFPHLGNIADDQLENVEYASLGLSTAVINYLAKAIQHLKRNLAANIWRALFVGSQSYLDALSQLASATDNYSSSINDLGTAIGISLLLQSRKAQDSMETILNDRKFKRQHDILEWLFSGTFSARHEATSDARVDNSGEWFIQSPKFQDWVNLRSSSNILLCPGDPGSGKSVIMSIAVDYFLEMYSAQNFNGLAYHYFDYKNQSNQRGVKVVGSLLKQLVSRLEDYPEELELLYEESVRTCTRPAFKVFLDVFILCSKIFKSTFVLLDAFDECNDVQQDEVLYLIRRLSEAKVNVLLTSRPHPEKLSQLAKMAVKLPIYAHPDDLENYLTLKLSKEAIADTIKHRVINRLKDGADGMFLLVEFQLKYVLSKVEPKKMKKALTELPKDLPDAYAVVIERISGRGVDAKDLSLRILAWILHAQRPLFMSELREALVIEEGETSIEEEDLLSQGMLLEVCEGLIAYDDATGTVRFVHYTVQEFLQRKYLSQLLSPVKFSKLCLTYLTFDVFSTGPCSNNSLLEQRIDSNRFARYASQFWVHYTRGKGEEFPDVRAYVFKLLRCIHFRNSFLQLASYPQTYTDGQTPLHILSNGGLNRICVMLLEKEYGKNVSVSKKYKNVPTQAKEVPSEISGDVRQKDGRGRTALHYATQSGHSDVVEALLDVNADPSAQDDEEMTPLHCASEGGHYEAASLLISKGADIRAQTRTGMSSLHYASQNGHVKVVTLLLKENAQIAERNKTGQTSLHCAAKYGHSGVVTKLLSEGASIDDVDWDGWTPIHLAVWHGHLSVVQTLLSHGASVDLRDKYDWTPLRLASRYGRTEIAQALIVAGANPLIQDSYGWTYLHWAARYGRVDTVKLLMEKIDKTSQDKRGWTALRLAEKLGHSEVVSALRL